MQGKLRAYLNETTVYVCARNDNVFLFKGWCMLNVCARATVVCVCVCNGQCESATTVCGSVIVCNGLGVCVSECNKGV